MLFKLRHLFKTFKNKSNLRDMSKNKMVLVCMTSKLSEQGRNLKMESLRSPTAVDFTFYLKIGNKLKSLR